MFVNILNVSTKRINTAVYKTRNLKVYDQQGTGDGHNKKSEHQKNCVINHINQFPCNKSYYCRERRVEQEYLPEGTILPLMYDLYKADNANAAEIFLEEFNLKTKPPPPQKKKKKKRHLKQKIYSLLGGDEKNLIILEKDKHQRQAEEARENMNLDLKAAGEDEKN